MTYAAIMVYVEADATPEHRVRLAATLADKFNSMLIGLSALGATAANRGGWHGCLMGRRAMDIDLMKAKLADRGSWFNRIAGGDQQKDRMAFITRPADRGGDTRGAQCRSCSYWADEGNGRRLQGARSGRSSSEDGSSDSGRARRSEYAASGACRDRLEGYSRGASGRVRRASSSASCDARNDRRKLARATRKIPHSGILMT